MGRPIKKIFIVPITKSYLDEGKVLLNSLHINNPNIPVHILTTDLTEDTFKEYSNVERVIIAPKCDTEFRQVRTYRFKYALEWAEEQQDIYGFDTDYVCALLDADMCHIRPVDLFFEMARSTMLVTSNNTVLRYIKKDFDKMNVPCPDDINVVMQTFCTVPTYLPPLEFKDYLLNIWNNSTGNDLEVPVLYAAVMNLRDRIYLLPSQNFNGIHHSQCKPETRVYPSDDGLLTLQHERVYSLHGHWLNPVYVKEMIDPMQRNYGYYPPYMDGARESIATIKREYDRYVR